MRVFVAFGYLSKEDWVRALVLPMLDHVGIEVVDGKQITGTSIDPALRERVTTSDALIGFLLRRKKNPNGTWTASDYVRQEINIAAGLGIPVIQVVEKGVRPVEGMVAGTQHLEYEQKNRADFLVHLLEHVRSWIAGEVYVRLAPAALVDALSAQDPERELPCEYDVLHQGHIERRGRALIFGSGGSMFVKLVGFLPGREANLRVQAGGTKWWTRGIAHTAPFVTIELSRPV